MAKVCSIFFFEGWLSTSPTVMNLVTYFAKYGYQVIIYTRDIEYTNPENLGSNIKTIYFSQPPGFVRFVKIAQSIPILNKLLPSISLALYASQILRYISKFPSPQSGNAISIGIDTNGSIVALLNSHFSKTKLVYLSLELSIERYFSRLDKLRMHAERLAYRRSNCVLIQDEDRLESLNKFNKYQHQSVFFLSNSILSNHCLSQEEIVERDYFRELFKLEVEKHPYLIVHAGWISDLFCSTEIATAFSSINSKYTLIFHERKKRDLSDPYISSLTKINQNNMLLSLDPLPYEEIDKIFASTTIGLAFYKEVDENFSNIAKASGKLSGYLKHGKPVLISNLQSLVQLNEKYQFGVVINDPSSSVEIEQAIEKILSNYDAYSHNAMICYHQNFDFDAQCKPFLEFIDGTLSI